MQGYLDAATEAVIGNLRIAIAPMSANAKRTFGIPLGTCEKRADNMHLSMRGAVIKQVCRLIPS